MKIIVGLLLILAAGLKVTAAFSNPAMAQQLDWLKALLPFEIAAELGIGILALCGIYWRQVRWVAIALFSVFAAYALLLALQGATSCGCFGPVKVNPWWTFGLDVFVVAGLIGEWWWVRRLPPSPNLSPEYGGEGYWGLMGVAGVSLTLFLALVWQMRPVVHADGLLQKVSGLTILEPEGWSGQPFPLTESIDVDLSKGEWLVVLHRHDCHDCQEAVPLYEELAASDAGKRVALIEVPPFAEEEAGEGSACLVARLTADREWFVQTPVEIRLRDGVVESASRELPGIHTEHVVGKGINERKARLVRLEY